MSFNTPDPVRGPIYRLPLEIKHAIVLEAVAADDGSCKDEITARSLALVGKELSMLVRPILFKALAFSYRPLAALEDFIDHAATAIKELVKSVNLNDYDELRGLESYTEVGRIRRETCAELLRALPALTEVYFPLPLNVWGHERLVLLYVFDSKLGGRMRKLAIEGGAVALATLLSRTPNLRHLALGRQFAFHDDHEAVFASLKELVSFEVHFIACNSVGLGAPIAWNRHLRSMAIDLAETDSEDAPFLPILEHLTSGASANLVRLKLGLATPEGVASPPLALPSLAFLELKAPNPYNHLSLFIHSALRRLVLTTSTEPWPPRPLYTGPLPLAETLLQPLRPTLKHIFCDFVGIELSIEDIEGVEQWCDNAGVELVGGIDFGAEGEAEERMAELDE